MKRLENKLALITAAASGMGRAGVELFAREGAKVAAVDINAEALAQLAAEMSRQGHKIETVRADLTTEAGARDCVNEAAARLGGLDVFWAHAGLPGPAGIEGLDLALYNKAMAINVTAPVISSGEAIKHMRKRGGGSIVFTASVSGLVGSMFSPTYSAAKFGVVGLAKSLAQTFAPDKVRVNALCPGLTETAMTIQFTSRRGDAEEAAENEKKFKLSVPMGRLGRAEEMARAALWLLSDDASYVTGIALPVDGGFSCK